MTDGADEVVRYEHSDGVAVVTMDDGKANALTYAMFDQLNAALDRAESDRAGVVLAGREGRFSAGFHLPTLTAGGTDTPKLLRTGFELSHRLLSFPLPVVVACTGHAFAMGSFLLLSADLRLGADGAHTITANEVAIGMTMPHAAIEVCRQRLTSTGMQRAVVLAERFTPESAVTVGFLDEVVPQADLLTVARERAALLRTLDLGAHAATKLRVRAAALAAIAEAIEADGRELAAALG